jgi:hypothetical protein
LVSCQDLSNITTRVFVQLLIIAKDYDGDIDGTEDGKLMRLLEQATFALKERSVGKKHRSAGNFSGLRRENLH